MEEQIQFIEKLEDVLNDSTLDTGVIEKTVGQLKNNVKQDKYLGYEQVEYFAKKIQSDLQEYTDSKNLIINHEQATHLDTELSDDNPINFNIVNGDIGFLTVNAFSSTKEIDLALDKINEIDTLIIDLRTNKGGKESVSRYLASYFFDQKTLLRRVIYKDKQNNTDVWTNPNKNNISKPLLPIYILVDKATSGLAERFTMSMKAYDKAYIVGEPTLGEISFIKSYPLLKGVSIELPVASIAGPKGETWPESGIEPDLSVVSVLAFREAQSMAQYSAMEYRVKTGRGTANEEYTVNKGEIDYGDWVLYNGSCLLKYKFAKPLFNKNKKTYSFPFQLMYYGINPTSMTYRLGNNDKTIKQTVNFTSRSDIKKGLAIGFKNPENFRVISCEHDK
ncbi:S41 family peptidase [Pseudoalteromonas umbrosa]|uniref:S41 family peptidase n=1 Tax=Pseudoalteromonas umbrosa TaxID=3048489 RepID=UPI0024C2D5AC|nr:S41 family peptidase [Pseudoalteromonas sp. B95]MDK1289727.1 S41 family peptidase [Pseudoalteromonas sp. B95]